MTKQQLILLSAVAALVIVTLYLNWRWYRLECWRRDINPGYRVRIVVRGRKQAGTVEMVNEHRVWVKLPDGYTRSCDRTRVWPA